MLYLKPSPFVDRYAARCRAWCAQYGLVAFRPALTGDHCALPLLGKRCQRHRRFYTDCLGCLPSSIADHGRYFRRGDDRAIKLFLGQPYNPLCPEDSAQLDRLRAMGFSVHVGGYGEGWYNSDTFPIVISGPPIPAHHYRCEAYSDD